ncbi:MAG: paraquat-inducible protein A [Thermodesulfobacteriota bacterium]|nr:paraquat-inducible protein A [Thermodesulfobacteriota bacterium]
MNLLACHECDLVHKIPPLPARATARCVRCGAVLFRDKPDSIDRPLALTLAGIVLFVVACSFPFLTLKHGDIVQKTALFTGIINLYRQGLPGLATLVLLTCVLVPLGQMLCMLYILTPLKQNRVAPYSAPLFRFYLDSQPWGMMEIFLIGILVALVKLGKMATIVPGLSVIAFGILIFVIAAASSAVDPHLVWERLGKKS